jgi:serine/threonine protein kinase
MTIENRTEILNAIKKGYKFVSGFLEIEVQGNISEGGTSVVYSCKIDGSEFDYALKILVDDISKKETSAFKRFKQAYVNLLPQIHNGFILPQVCIGKIQLQSGKVFPYSIMPKAAGTLQEKYKSKILEYSEFNTLALSLFSIVDKMHSCKIIHRDIKPQNIFYLGDNMVLGDCDIAHFDAIEHLKLVTTSPSDRIGNYAFSAPEQSNSKAEITFAADWYAVGQILFWLVNKRNYRGIDTIDFKFPDNPKNNYSDLANRMLQADPEKRPQSLSEIKDILKPRIDPVALHNKQIVESTTLFDEIVFKYTRQYGLMEPCYVEIKNENEIDDILSFLMKNVSQLDLIMYGSIGDFDFSSIQKIDKNHVIFGYFEMLIEYVSVMRSRFYPGASVIALHTKKLSPINSQSKGETEEICYFEDNIITRQEYDTGWAEIDGKIIDIRRGPTSVKVRAINDNVFFCAPKGGPIFTNQEVFDDLLLSKNGNALANFKASSKINNLRRHKILIGEC